MLQTLFDFYMDVFVNHLIGSGPLYNILVSNVTINDTTVTFVQYFAFILSLISLIVIIVLCCMLIKKIYNICAHVIG